MDGMLSQDEINALLAGMDTSGGGDAGGGDAPADAAADAPAADAGGAPSGGSGFQAGEMWPFRRERMLILRFTASATHGKNDS